MTKNVASKSCTVDGCENKYYGVGYCNKHYIAFRKHGDPLFVHQRFRKKFCKVEGCERALEGLGYCSLHYRPFKLYGDPLARRQAKKGDGHITKEGYRMIVAKGHPNTINKQGQILEHRFVMSQYLGRPLRKGENVHHINGNRLDNRIENLELWVSLQPSGQRPADLVAYAREILALYGNEVDRKP